MKYNITYRDEMGNEKKHENISESEWRFIRAVCDENGWEITLSEPVKSD